METINKNNEIGYRIFPKLVTFITSANAYPMGKRSWGNRPRVSFILKKPSDKDGRRTFQVLRRTTPPGGKPVHQVIQDERILALNIAFKRGSLKLAQCEIQAELVVKDMLEAVKAKLPRPVFNEENREALSAYWEKEYAARRLVDPEAGQNRLRRAVESVGSLSLYSSSRSDLQKAVNRKYQDNRQRSIVDALNQILKFLGRDFELARHEEIEKDIRHLTVPEFHKVLNYVENPIDRTLEQVGFYTGLRQGEIFALTLESIADDRVFSKMQMDRYLNKRPTKRKRVKQRQIYIIPGGRQAVEEWAKLPMSIKKEWRNRKHSEVFMNACKKAFPEIQEKHCTFHDLRHSFAVYLVSHGANITQVAQCLNNSVAVCEKYYSGYVLHDETISTLDRIIKNASVVER